MSFTAKLDDVYVKYLLNDRDVSKTLPYVNISRTTLLKYIRIKECLDFSLLPEMDLKKDKLTIEMAIYLCDHVLNPTMQAEIYPKIKTLKKPDKKRVIGESCECLLCADTKVAFEETPCCGNILCEGCLMRVYDEAIDSTHFKPVRCPFCSQCFTLKEVKKFLCKKYYYGVRGRQKPKYLHDWRNNKKYRQNLSCNFTYSRNLHRKYLMMIDAIEDIQRKPQGERILNKENLKSRDFSKVGDKSLYYGSCSACTPPVSNLRPMHWGHIKMCTVEKQCAQGDGELAVLEPHMFLCVVCKSLQEPEDATIKKCPHCGIKTLKPEGCNYVVCGDHRWCWICNERLEVNHDGHNTHYYTGLDGASPYASECRKSLEQNKPLFTLRSCDCSACSPFGGAPLCKTLDCMKRALWRPPLQEQVRPGDFKLTREYCHDCHTSLWKNHRE